MTEDIMHAERHPDATRQSVLEHKLAATGWGLFFLWVGVAAFAGFDVGLGLLGVGIITIGIQLVRTAFGLGVEGFWLIVGLLFGLGGLAELFSLDIPVVPIVLVVAGLLLLASVLRR